MYLVPGAPIWVLFFSNQNRYALNLPRYALFVGLFRQPTLPFNWRISVLKGPLRNYSACLPYYSFKKVTLLAPAAQKWLPPTSGLLMLFEALRAAFYATRSQPSWSVPALRRRTRGFRKRLSIKRYLSSTR
jgi:hypothetical protein